MVLKESLETMISLRSKLRLRRLRLKNNPPEMPLPKLGLVNGSTTCKLTVLLERNGSKKSEKGCQPTIVTADKPCHHRTEVFQAIRDQWQDVWTKAKRISPLSQAAKLRWIADQCPGPSPVPVTQRPSEVEPSGAVQDLITRSSGRPDQWSKPCP